MTISLPNRLKRYWKTMKSARSAQCCVSGGRKLRMESMEPRQLLAAQGFLQGVAFVDGNSNGMLDAGEQRKDGAEIKLWKFTEITADGQVTPDELTSPQSAFTNFSGYYLFQGLEAGTYLLQEVAPVGFTTTDAQIFSQLYPATELPDHSILVQVLDDQDPADPNLLVTMDLNNAPIFEDLSFDLTTVPAVPGNHVDSAMGLLPITLSGGGLPVSTAVIQSFCVNIHESLFGGVENFDVLPQFQPLDSITQTNWERIAYLYNHYATDIFGTNEMTSTINAAAMQLAIYELLYDQQTGTALEASDPWNTGTLQNVTEFPGGTTDPITELPLVLAKAAFYVQQSVGKSEAAIYLDASLGDPTYPESDYGRQSVICTNWYNFANGGTPDIELEKFTNGVDADTMEEGPEIAPGDIVTWTYHVTNTGTVPFTSGQISITDDAGTPGDLSDDYSTANGDITFQSVLVGDGDTLLEPGETWVYVASDVAQDLGGGPVGSPISFDFSGSSALDGPDGNIRTFTAGGVSVKASAFSRDAGGVWSSAFLGAYSGGLGVTDAIEGDGGSNTHTVDNVGRDNYVLFEFSETVVVDSAFLGYVVDDSDITIWIGTLTDPFNNHVTLSDAVLAGLGFTEVNLGGSTTRTADFNAGEVSGNVMVIAARTGETSPTDRFKIEKAKVQKTEEVCYENYAVVTTFPGGPTDTDNSFYCNPHGEPGIDIEKTTNGPTNANPTPPDYDNEDAANGAGVPILTPGSTVTWTYKVTNTGTLPFAASDIVVTDDSGTPGNTADDLSTTDGEITFQSVAVGDADNILEPGEVWLYTASGTVQNLSAPAPGAPTMFDMSGSSGVTGAAGNVRTFTSGSISVKASAFSRDKFSGSWANAYVGSYGGGLGVTDGSEDGSGDSHTVDNVGRDNYVLFRFSENVIVDSAFLGYVVGDSDVKIWIGTIPNAFSGSVTLSDAVLTSLGFTQVDLASNGSTRTADFNSGNLSGNVLVIAADPGDTTPDDKFKIELLTVKKSQPGTYENKATVTVPGDSDSDLSHYKNPTAPPPPTGSIGGKKYQDQTGNGLTSDDTPLSGTTIYLDLNNDGDKDASEPSTTTGSDGRYQFNGLALGTYYVREVVPYGFIRTAPTLSDHYVVTVSGSTAVNGKDFANYAKCDDCGITCITYTIKRGGSTFTVSDLRGNVNQGDIVTVNFTVTSGVHEFSLVSYSAPDPYYDTNRASLQKIYEGQTGFFKAGTHSMTVKVPSTYFQVDFVCGDIIDTLGPAGSNIFYTPQGRLFSADNDGSTAPPANLQSLGTTLVVGGGSGDDNIQLKVDSDPSKIAVVFNGSTVGRVSLGSGSGVSLAKILGYGNAGNDMILITGLSLAATLRGGDGNDVLVGGLGADNIQGDGGRDIMIGGSGKDVIHGNAQDDILIGGTTAYDANFTALDKIMDEWARNDTFANRVNRLKSGVSDGLNGSYNLIADGASKTVFDDSVQDSLYGDEGNDWILGNSDADGGSVNDLVFSGEQLTDID